MKTTLYPEIIYEALAKYGFPALRIDEFDRGNYAEIRAELNFTESLNPADLQDIALKLNLMEKNEGIKINIINIDTVHKTIRINIYINNSGKEEGST